MMLEYFAEDVANAQALDILRKSEVTYRAAEDEIGGKRCGICDNCVHPPHVQESPRETREHRKEEEPERLEARFKQGDKVRVRRYGEGIVELVSGERVAVRFPDDETRSFIARYVRHAKH
jgi:ATP-dependent DNA helicase RecQ